MVLRVLDPVADTRPAETGRSLRKIKSLDKLRVAFVWSGHAASVRLWPALERAVEQRFEPSAARKIYKPSTWNAASPAEIEEIARASDYAIVGVGA